MFKFLIIGTFINSIFFYSYNYNKKIYYTLNIISISYLLTYNLII